MEVDAERNSLVDSSEKHFEEMYYFRWYAWPKHLVKSPKGYIVTEWLPKPDFKDGSYGALPDAAPFHLGEARWLRDPKIAEDVSRYWFSPGVDGHKYSDALAWAVHQVALANGNQALEASLLPAMIASYREWETAQQDQNGLFWSIDTRDAMEKSISGDGYRPTLNSYMYGDARAIAAIASDHGTKAEFESKADRLRELIEARLWNPEDQFYEVLSPSTDSGIRKQKKFVDNGSSLKVSGVREQIGYFRGSLASPRTVMEWLGSSYSIRLDLRADLEPPRPNDAVPGSASRVPINAPGTGPSGRLR